jgi:hypothetical protein
MKNIIPSVDAETPNAVRKFVKKHNIALNALFRRLFRKPVKKTSTQWFKESFQLVEGAQANSRGKVWKRENLYRV